MTEHEEPIDDAERRRRVRGLSPAELLGTLTDGAPTEGDLRMLMEPRVGLAVEGCSGDAQLFWTSGLVAPRWGEPSVSNGAPTT